MYGSPVINPSGISYKNSILTEYCHVSEIIFENFPLNQRVLRSQLTLLSSTKHWFLDNGDVLHYPHLKSVTFKSKDTDLTENYSNNNSFNPNKSYIILNDMIFKEIFTNFEYGENGNICIKNDQLAYVLQNYTQCVITKSFSPTNEQLFFNKLREQKVTHKQAVYLTQPTFILNPINVFIANNEDLKQCEDQIVNDENNYVYSVNASDTWEDLWFFY